MSAPVTHRFRIARTLAGLWLASVLAPCGLVLASGLQVTPTSISLQPTRQADGLWLRNSGDAPLHAQVRVYHWTQENGKDQLTPTRALVASPPMLKLDQGKSQLVRVIRTNVPPSQAEQAYRVIVNELPPAKDTGGGLSFVLRYSIPVFVQAVDAPDARPELTWSLNHDNGHLVLGVSNDGRQHAQISNVRFTDGSGHRHPLKQGLLGYVLPGRKMHWELPLDGSLISAGGTIEAKVNGESVTPTVSLDAGTR